MLRSELGRIRVRMQSELGYDQVKGSDSKRQKRKLRREGGGRECHEHEFKSRMTLEVNLRVGGRRDT